MAETYSIEDIKRRLKGLVKGISSVKNSEDLFDKIRNYVYHG